MSHDYTSTGARRARCGRVLPAMTLAAVVACAAMLLAGCGALPSPRPSTAAEAYDAAHPAEQGPPSLRAVSLTRRQVSGRVAAVVEDGTRILLPLYLPPRYGLAAPYISVGEGSARPNPEGWGASYRVSYTDGHGLLVITSGALRVPDGVAWNGKRLRVDGRPARAGSAGGTTVVATVRGKPRIVVTGLHMATGDVVACVVSIAPSR